MLKLTRKFVGFFQGQIDLIQAETNRRHISTGDLVREVFDLGVPKYRKMYKLPPTYPNNQLDINK